MNDPIIDREQLAELIGRLLDDQATTEQIALLESALGQNAEYRQIYRNELQTHASLSFPRRWQPSTQSIAASMADPPPLGVERPEMRQRVEPQATADTKRPSLTSLALLAAAACLLMTIGGVTTAWYRDLASSGGHGTLGASNNDHSSVGLVAGSPQTNVTIAVEAVARIGETVDARWETVPRSNKPSLGAGASLRPGWLRLRSGVVRVDFLSGARVVLKGPAELEIRSPWEANLKSGSVSCQVAQWARGFRLMARGMEVLDLGTEFGVRIDALGTPEVHVFNGKVAVFGIAGRKHVEVAEQQAMRLVDGVLQKAEYSVEGFTTIDQFSRSAEQSKLRRFSRWREAAERLDRDPATLVHYTFSNYTQGDLQVANQASNGSNGSDALVVGCRQSEGRWPEKKAIEMHGRGDRMLLSQDGLHKQLTGIIWVRVDDLTQPLTGLLMSEAPRRRSGHQGSDWDPIAPSAISQSFDAAPIKMIRWEISGKHNLLFNMYQGPADVDRNSWVTYSSQPRITPDQFGQWIQLGVVYDSDDGMLQQYLNGKMISRRVTDESYPLFLGHLAVGNLSRSKEEESMPQTSREFIGAIDELLISSRSFSHEEILENWAVGRP